MIVPVSTEAHHAAHLEPILAHLPHASAHRRPDDIALVASYGSLSRARRDGYARFVLAQHGAGQSYGGSPHHANHPSYPGGSNNKEVGLFLVPNEHAAGRWRRAYPRTPVAVVGCPKLDTLPAREYRNGEMREPVVAVSFHWDMHGLPELRSAQTYYWRTMEKLARRFLVIGHGHPKRRDLGRLWRMLKVPYVPDFNDVCRRADVYVCDNSSTIFEFAATGRPVVVLNIPEYRREVNHGLRFWDAASIGVQVNHPDELVDAVRLALDDPPEQQAAREKALSLVYAYRTGASERAAGAIMDWAGVEQVAA